MKGKIFYYFTIELAHVHSLPLILENDVQININKTDCIYSEFILFLFIIHFNHNILLLSKDA